MFLSDIRARMRSALIKFLGNPRLGGFNTVKKDSLITKEEEDNFVGTDNMNWLKFGNPPCCPFKTMHSSGCKYGTD